MCWPSLWPRLKSSPRARRSWHIYWSELSYADAWWRLNAFPFPVCVLLQMWQCTAFDRSLNFFFSKISFHFPLSRTYFFFHFHLSWLSRTTRWPVGNESRCFTTSIQIFTCRIGGMSTEGRDDCPRWKCPGKTVKTVGHQASMRWCTDYEKWAEGVKDNQKLFYYFD